MYKIKMDKINKEEEKKISQIKVIELLIIIIKK